MRNKIGIAFGGGSGRGVAHLGVIKCLEEYRIRTEIVTGTSIGSLIGALYACGLSYKEIRELTEKTTKTEAFKELGFEFFKEHKDQRLITQMSSYLKERFAYARMLITPYITEREVLENMIEKIIPDRKIEELDKRFGAMTLDLKSGEDVLITSGSLREAVTKSISITGIFPPWEEDGRCIVDGGPTSNVPVEAAYSLGAHKVIGVNLSNKLSETFNKKSGLTLNFRVDEIAKFRLNKKQAEKADVLIEPPVKSIHWADFSKFDFGTRTGYRTTRKKINLIKNLQREPFLNRMRRFFSSG